jgi:hypothetical protein
MTPEELAATLEAHRKWLLNPKDGARANLSRTNLSGANLDGANLSRANLSVANLDGANLSGAKLDVANLDFSCLPLKCSGLAAKVDDRLARQFMYHALHYALSVDAPGITQKLLDWTNKFHRVGEVPRLVMKKGDQP